MAFCKVVKPVLGWNFGDRVEAFGDRLEELVKAGVVDVEVPDAPVIEEKSVVEEVVAPVEKKRGRPRKGGE